MSDRPLRQARPPNRSARHRSLGPASPHRCGWASVRQRRFARRDRWSTPPPSPETPRATARAFQAPRPPPPAPRQARGRAALPAPRPNRHGPAPAWSPQAGPSTGHAPRAPRPDASRDQRPARPRPTRRVPPSPCAGSPHLTPCPPQLSKTQTCHKQVAKGFTRLCLRPRRPPLRVFPAARAASRETPPRAGREDR